MPEDVDLVYEEWSQRQDRPSACKLTPSRRGLIERALRSASAAQLCALIEYANEADTGEARFWRGENAQGRTYLDLENLFRVNKLDSRIERADAWKSRKRGDVDEQEVRLDVVGRMRRGL